MGLEDANSESLTSKIKRVVGLKPAARTDNCQGVCVEGEEFLASLLKKITNKDTRMDVMGVVNEEFNGFRGTNSLVLERDFGVTIEELKRRLQKGKTVKNRQPTFANDCRDQDSIRAFSVVERRKNAVSLAFSSVAELERTTGRQASPILLKLLIDRSRLDTGFLTPTLFRSGGLKIVGYKELTPEDLKPPVNY